MQQYFVDEEKKLLRKKILKLRDSIPPGDRIEYSTKIAECIFCESKYVRANNVLIYNHFGSEVRCDYIFSKSLKDGKNVFFPKVEGEYMTFYKITSAEQLEAGYKGILEPFGNTGRFEQIGKSIIIVPGTVFGQDGYRIGYGKGYYDKFLASVPDIYKIGVCFSVQLVDKVPRDQYDVQMDEIICENRILSKDGKGEARWMI